MNVKMQELIQNQKDFEAELQQKTEESITLILEYPGAGFGEDAKLHIASMIRGLVSTSYTLGETNAKLNP